MPTSPVGSIYRERRERLRIPIEVAADATNIRARVLETLEASDFKNYPPRGHAVGMLSSYARYLELDPRPLLEQYEAEFAAFEAGEKMSTSAERTRKGLGRYGERTTATDKPLPREAARKGGLLARKRKHDEDDSASRLNEKLDNERIAEGDDRYKSGTVKVVGKRQADSFRRTASSRSRARGAAPGAAATSGRERLSGSSAVRGSGSGRDTSASERSRASGSLRAPRRDDMRLAQRGAQEPPAVRREGESGDDTGKTAGSYARPERSAYAASLASARAHQDELDKPEQEGSSRTPNFFGVDVDAGNAPVSDAPRRPRTHRVSQTEARQEQTADGNILTRLSNTLKSVFEESRTRLIVLAFVIIAIGVIAATAVLISTAGDSNAGVLGVQGGVEDTSTVQQDPGSATTTVTTSNGSPVNVVISVDEGQTSLIDVTYDDDNAYNGTAVGPWSRSFYVTDSLSASFENASAVNVTENGNPIDFQVNEDGTGLFNLVIATTTSNTQTSSSGSGQSSSQDSSDAAQSGDEDSAS